MFLDAERERFAAEITQAQAEIEAALSFFEPLDGGWSYPAGKVVYPLSRSHPPIYQGSSNEHFRIGCCKRNE